MVHITLVKKSWVSLQDILSDNIIFTNYFNDGLRIFIRNPSLSFQELLIFIGIDVS